ncbi:MAG: hypothetical protein ACRDTC_12695 [Pseudonocardiaceae bacterium]
MASESEFMSSALFGADGTELPDPLPVFFDSLTGPEQSAWWDTSELPSIPVTDASDQIRIIGVLPAEDL